MQGRLQADGPLPSGQSATLWSSSRAWRALVTTSCLLTALAICSPIVLPRAADSLAEKSCNQQIVGEPRHFAARVTGFVPGDAVAATTRAVEARIGVKISPGYLPLRRISAVGLQASSRLSTMAAIPDNVTPKVGDIVDLIGRYRDPHLPCNFIPWTVNRVLTSADAPFSNANRGWASDLNTLAPRYGDHQ